MPTTPLGIPTPADSVKISELAKTQRDGFNKVDQLFQAFESEGAARGTLPPGTNLNSLMGVESYGYWLLEAGATYPNAPQESFTQNALLAVLPSGQFRLTQTVTEYNKEHFRTAPLGTFGNWRTNLTTEEFNVSALRIDLGILPEGTNLNTFDDAEYAGVYILEAGKTYVNGPKGSFSQNALLEVVPGSGRRITQRVTEFNKMHFRAAPAGLMGNWRTSATTEITDVLETRVSQLEESAEAGIIKSAAAVLAREDGTLEFSKAADSLQIPASLTKMLTAYVARTFFTDARLDEATTLTTEDALSGSSPALQVGDVITYRELFYMAMLPSHNVAAELLAARAGSEINGSQSPRDKFIGAMNSTVQGWGWTGANFVSASGLGTANKATPRQMAELLLRIHDEDSTLIGIMGELSHEVQISGPNARTFNISHSIPVNGDPGFPEFVAAKTGTLTGIVGNVAMVVETRGIRRAIVTMGALPVNDRYPDARRILNTLGLTDLPLAAADLSGLGSHIRITNTNGWVGLSFAAAKLPANANIPGAIPRGFRPTGFSYGVLTVREGNTIRTVQVSLTTAGDLIFSGNLGTDGLRGMVTWPAA